MLTIFITFAVLVALWGFSGTLASRARRSIARSPRTARAAPRPVRTAVRGRSRARGPIASA